MKIKLTTTILASALAPALILLFSSGTPVSASDEQNGHERNGHLQIQKDCEANNGKAGGHCTIKVSNLAEIPSGSNIYYDQDLGIPAGLLDSNIVLDAGNGNRGVGRCTIDLATALGLCTFSDGTGQLAGFSARVNVSFLGGTMWAWDGTYKFSPLPSR